MASVSADGERDLAARWEQHMRRGDFASAWQVSDAIQVLQRQRPRDWSVPRHFQSIWDGRPLTGARVLVRCYHGLGDTLQFIRYAPLVRAQARQVSVWAQPALLPLLATVSGIDRLLPLHDGDPGVDYDVDVEVMELPHVFRTTQATIPNDVPYINVEPDAVQRPTGPAVGLVWRAGDWAPHRSLPFDELMPLRTLPVTWYILQGRPELAECPPGFGIVRGTGSVVELARTIAALDLVITIDSMPAHLAGALGTPVWTLLSAQADWRWMHDRTDTPWYPTMRLFRQTQLGVWRDVIDAVHARLRTW